jgi:hypothetical protein
MFIIKDWAGNHCYANKTWHTIEDVIDFLTAHFPDDASDFYILRTDNNRFSYHIDKDKPRN